MLLGPSGVGRLDHITRIYPGARGPILGVLLEGTVRVDDLRSLGVAVIGRAPNGVLAARVPVGSLAALASMSGLRRAQTALSRDLSVDRSVPLAFGHAVPFDAAGMDRSMTGLGTHSLVAILDTGVDVTHPGLRAADGSTRVVGLLDVATGTAWTAAEIDADPDAVPADESGHGTHVAGVVAGDGDSFTGQTPFIGMAPEAGILAVKVADATGSVPEDAILAGLEWAQARRDEIEADRGAPTPLVANLSFGGLLGPNDGTSVCDLAISAFAEAGMTVVASAGNEHGQGVHTQGEMTPTASRELTFDRIAWTRTSRMVVSLWYDPDFELSVEMLDRFPIVPRPGAILFDNGSASMGIGDAGAVRSGRSTLTVAHTDEGVSGRHVFISMDGDFDPGTLTLRLTTPADVGSGTWHAWIDTAGAQVAWDNPVESATINSPATAEHAIAVASFASRTGGPSTAVGDISVFSSSGPIRRQNPLAPKPDIAAGGEVVVSTRSGFSALTPITPSDYEGRTGTSQATPIVAGAAALMLSQFPHMTGVEVRQALLDAAESEAGDDPDRWGAGRVNVVAAIAGITRDTEAPALLSSTPVDGASALDPTELEAAGIVLVFSEPVGGGASLRLDGTELPTTVLIDDARLVLSIVGDAVIEVGREYVVRVEVTDASGNPFITQVTFDTIPPRDPADVNGDGRVDIVDIVVVATAFGGDAALTPSADVNADGVINVVDLITVAVRFGLAAAPSASGYAQLAAARDMLRAGDYVSADARHALGLLDALLAAEDTAPTALLAPFPNPFNPDTWIPFRLQDDALVAVSIYDATGERVRRLGLGVLRAGVYATPGRAIAWDGRNDAGERVVSGWYAVELVAGAERRTARVLLAK
ncbi:S8 family serine peptidase [Candidatus Poribacteria bacterium]|jgi:subtilisin family serine protease|nr:S8 family serine peptidase [Candidatus Poribacteria bacterium]MBT5532164.1 S8 family serine peptidase [Candidatus Poribacteria bacterium]MBT7101394.1 S8 family serine peptidase [Candidatus Poribacteria bacterium]MBT7806984.1 S8 family serine peptidase [Candidatus Poribacteria bacterium]